MPTDESDDLERVVMIQHLKPERVDEYVAAHDEVPESVAETMDEGGVETYELYVYDDVAVSIIEVADFEKFEETYESVPENRAWEERVARFKRSGIDPDEMEMPTVERIWSLSDENA